MSHKNYNSTYRRNNRHRNNDPLWLMLGGVGLVAIAFFFVFLGKPSAKAPVEVAGAPSLKVDKDQVDLGDEKLGQTVKVSFDITNVGDQPLRFSKEPYVEVKEGC